MKLLPNKILLTLAILLIKAPAFSQGKKQQQLFTEFVTIANSYKQLPLQLEVEYRHSDNMTTEPLQVLTGKFHMEKGNAYISFGDVEQIITDSAVLVVMKDVKRMMLMGNTMDISTLLSQSTAVLGSGKSVKELSERYHISSYDTSGSMKVISMKSKQVFKGTDISMEEIILVRLVKKEEPYAIVTKKRTLLKKDMVTDKTLGMPVINIEGYGEFFVKEETATCYFKSIEHSNNAKSPVILSDRIARSADGTMEPTGDYASYDLSVQ